MRIAALLLAAALAAGCSSPGAGRAPLESRADIEAWMEDYSLHPEPDRFPEALSAARRCGLLTDFSIDPLFVGFTAEVLRLHPDRLDDWVDTLPTKTRDDRTFLQVVLFFCGTDASSRRLREFRAGLDPDERRGHGTFMFDIARVPVRNIPLAVLPAIDLLWGSWLASGDPVLVRRILAAADLRSSPNSEFRSTGEAAWNSLLRRASRDPRIRHLLGEEAARRPGPEGAAVRDLLEALPPPPTSRPRE